jgi:hypothetical protein
MIYSGREKKHFKELTDCLPEGDDEVYARMMLEEANQLSKLPGPMIIGLISYLACRIGAFKPRNWEKALNCFDEMMQKIGFTMSGEPTYEIIKGIFEEDIDEPQTA